MDKPGYFAILPAKVRYDEELRPNAKLLYAELTALTDKTGCCWASNEYFMHLYGIGDKTVADLIKQLRDKGYIFTAIRKFNGSNVRIITLDEETIGLVKDAKNGTLDFKDAKNGTLKDAKNGGQNNINNINNNPPINPPTGGKRTRKPEWKATTDHEPERFEKLWKWYPHRKRGNRQRAIAAWDALAGSPELLDIIAQSLKAQSKSEDWQAGIGISHLSTYLNNYGWEGALDPEPDESTADTGSGWADDPEVL